MLPVYLAFHGSVMAESPPQTLSSAGFARSVKFDLRRPGAVLFVAWLIFFGALGLRLTAIGDYPARHATDDEFGFLWGGLNLWDSGVPSSWSNLGQNLPAGSVTFDGVDYRIVAPYLDHPPLFTALVGAGAKLTGPRRMETVDNGKVFTVWDVNLHRARLMMIPVFIASFWLLFSLTATAFSPPVALVTVLFYGFMSHAVAHGRLIMADNLSAMLLLANAWAVQRWLAGLMSQRRMAILTVTFTAAAILTKIPAWCHVPAMIAVLLTARRRDGIRYVLYGFGLGLVLYLAWLAWYGLPEFLSVMKSQSNRFRGFNAFQRMSGVPKLLDVHDLNGVIMAGWFCMLAQALHKGARPLTVAGPAYVLAFTFFAGDVLFGWYTLPLYPWLALGLGITTAQVYYRPRSPMMVAWLLLFLPHAFQTIYIAHYELETVLRYAFIVVTAGLLFAFLLKPNRSRSVLRMAIIGIVAAVLMREVYEVTNQRTDRLTDTEKYFPEIPRPKLVEDNADLLNSIPAKKIVNH